MANGGGVTVRDSVVWGNAGYQIRAFGAPYNAGTWANASYSCVEGGFTGSGNISADPQFASPASGDYGLSATSPCIDAGDPASLPDPDATRADMGCFWFAQGVSGPAAVSTYGLGCGQPSLLLSASPGSLPLLGGSLSLAMANVPGAYANLFLGWSDTLVGPFALPFSLAGYGLAGCFMLQSGDSGLIPMSTSGSGAASFTFGIPYLPQLLGVRVFAQGLAPSPGANLGGAVVSNGVALTFGTY